MKKYHVLNIRTDIWDALVIKSESIIGMNASSLAKQYLLEGLNPLQTYTHPPKSSSAARGEIKKSIPRTGKKFLYWDPGTGTTGWYYEKDNKEEYNTFFYWCEKMNYLTDDMYGPLFVSGEVEITEDMMERSKLMVMARDAYLKKLNAPQVNRSQMTDDNDEELEAYNKQRRDDIEEAHERT